jgi:simple sugar transport system ATP-binding protein
VDHHLVLDGVSKTFGALRANDGVTLRVRRGSVHAVLGENGAGKSTLMNILYGLYQPDEGRIQVGGREVQIDSPRTALRLGIGMVHQHFMLVGPLTVVENAVLGTGGRRLRLDLEAAARRLRQLARSFGFEIEPHAAVWQLPIGMQQRVEILKLLYHEADILILDEPTSVLTPNETGPFFDVLRRLRAAGKTILFITHKLDEVMAVADRVTVMRHGRVSAEVEAAETDPRALARLMVGRDVVFDVAREAGTPGRVMLAVEDARARSDRGTVALDGISLTVRAGEILGVAGVDGNGQTELAEVIAGLRPLTSGRVRLADRDVSGASVAERKHRFRLGYVPEDRQRTGLVLGRSAGLNLILRNYRQRAFARLGFLDLGAVRAHGARLVRQYDIRLRDLDQPVRYLSGGNQQKLILAREIEDRPDVLVVSQPTKGLDVGAIEFVQRTLLEERRRGAAILYISTELEHLMAVSDRIGVLFGGRLTGLLDIAEVTPERLGLLMAGVAA